MSRKLFWLSDKQWARVEPHLPTDVRGVERVDDRRVISGIVHVLKSGCRWCDCPEAYGPYTTIYNRFVRRARRGIWENLFREIAGNGRSADTQMIDSTHVKALSLPQIQSDWWVDENRVKLEPDVGPVPPHCWNCHRSVPIAGRP
jgi:transposase